ncbi:probable Bax inhibitor 1 [Sycon ciliatum]|uniref:probable Bax inhibitor 1 n=1 Tax=Sycon ciliatum TaxID=27933 RepID=UPI0020A8405E|eukprot:scpid47367/ scgid34625/ Probable Bax inhibitor 1; Testis-enhanced gene transcript protein homolog; Transmembrane BAX inhibitor motif-containing protein 6
MESMFGRHAPSLSALSDFSKLSHDDRSHLKKVYTSLSLTLLAATAGSAVNVLLGMFQGAFLASIVSIGLLLALRFNPDNGKNLATRLGLLAGFGFFSGVSMGPLIAHVAAIDPSLIFTALGGTVVVFVSFSLSALYAEERSYLYLGGYLLSGLNFLLLTSLVNMFIGSIFVLEVQLYLGLAIFCAFVLYDTQLIIEKSRMGDKDYIWHSVDLFLDFIEIFRRLLIILAKDDKKKKRRD